jgi:uncharacterized protein
MRDLASRLRDIVRQSPRTSGPTQGGLRELTYVPDGESAPDAAGAARGLGGTVHESSGGACIVVDREWDASEWHGRMRVASLGLGGEAPIALFDPRLAAAHDWARRVVYFDIETTGLSGGAGTLAFLAGCGWWEDDAFRVRQFFLNGPADERAMLDALGEVFDDASLLVTFNGRTFDVPMMETRWAFHRRACPTDDLAHFDMLPPARRLWGRRGLLEPDTGRCNLSALERSVLGFHRVADVPGFEIPARYFQFLRSGDPSVVEGVLEHNRHDIVSLAAITAHALRLAAEGPEACRDAGEQLALGRLYEHAGDAVRAEDALARAARAADVVVRAHALARMAHLYRRTARYEESASAWTGVLEAARRGRGALAGLEHRAAEALAIHHEHRGKDPEQARRYAEALAAGVVHAASPTVVAGVRHRLARLDRKIKSRENTKGGPEAAPLLHDVDKTS